MYAATVSVCSDGNEQSGTKKWNKPKKEEKFKEKGNIVQIGLGKNVL